jgi:ATP-binding cassette subfamily B protein
LPIARRTFAGASARLFVGQHRLVTGHQLTAGTAMVAFVQSRGSRSRFSAAFADRKTFAFLWPGVQDSGLGSARWEHGGERRMANFLRRRWAAYRAEAMAPRLALIRRLPLAGPGLLVALTVASVAIGLLPVGFVVGTSLLVGAVPGAVADGIGSPAWNRLLTAFLAASAAFFAQQLLTPVHSALGVAMKHRVDGRYRDRLLAASLGGVGIGALEDQDSLASLREIVEAIETGWRTPGDACVATLALVARYVRLIGFGVVIGVALSWTAAVAVCLSTMLFRYGHRSALRIRMRVWPKLMAARRESAYFRDLGLTAATAKEIRVLDVNRWLVERYRTSALGFLWPMFRARRQVNITRFLWLSPVGLLVTTAVFVVIVRAAARGEVTLTAFSLALQATVAAVLLGEFYHEADDATQYGVGAESSLTDFEGRVRATAGRDVPDGATGDASGLPIGEISLVNVSFTYPGEARPVLDGLNLSLRVGECTALVGLNGAGKTTLVKLLARLYEPDNGAILVDGRDIRDLAVDSWRRQLAVIFQNFNRYELSAADNIAFGAVERPPGDAVRAAAEAAGVADVLDALPLGLNSPLSRTLPGGADLSGGQWQRIAIARAFFALGAGARLLVLDEPTAALDVKSETRFFDEFADVARGVASLLISHRFSSVRRADRIVVLENGRIVQDGTHDALLAAGGRYAEMFTAQAAWYDDEEVR